MPVASAMHGGVHREGYSERVRKYKAQWPSSQPPVPVPVLLPSSDPQPSTLERAWRLKQEGGDLFVQNNIVGAAAKYRNAVQLLQNGACHHCRVAVAAVL